MPMQSNQNLALQNAMFFLPLPFWTRRDKLGIVRESPSRDLHPCSPTELCQPRDLTHAPPTSPDLPQQKKCVLCAKPKHSSAIKAHHIKQQTRRKFNKASVGNVYSAPCPVKSGGLELQNRSVIQRKTAHQLLHLPTGLFQATLPEKL